MRTQSKPIAVLISDIHFNLATLERAKAALNQAVDKANNLNVPLIIAGDMHDTKANLRAECVTAILDCLDNLKGQLNTFVLIGNHDKLNEKSEGHALTFLQTIDRVIVVDKPRYLPDLNITLIPYQYDMGFLIQRVKLAAGKVIIMHQGLTGSASGEYIQDKTALSPQDVAGKRIISGHYHTRQKMTLPDGGVWDFIGNPYTLNYGEAEDPDKGFQILFDDGRLEFVPTNLPNHVKITLDLETGSVTQTNFAKCEDFVKVLVRGPSDLLSTVTKKQVGDKLSINDIPFQLELEPTEITQENTVYTAVSSPELMDQVIEGSDMDKDRKERIKLLWRTLK